MSASAEYRHNVCNAWRIQFNASICELNFGSNPPPPGPNMAWNFRMHATRYYLLIAKFANSFCSLQYKVSYLTIIYSRKKHSIKHLLLTVSSFKSFIDNTMHNILVGLRRKDDFLLSFASFSILIEFFLYYRIKYMPYQVDNEKTLFSFACQTLKGTYSWTEGRLGSTRVQAMRSLVT